MRAISQEIPQPSVTKINLKITYLPLNLPGADKLNDRGCKHFSEHCGVPIDIVSDIMLIEADALPLQ